MTDIKKDRGWTKWLEISPLAYFPTGGFPCWVLFLPGWEPVGHLARTYKIANSQTKYSYAHGILTYTSSILVSFYKMIFAKHFHTSTKQ